MATLKFVNGDKIHKLSTIPPTFSALQESLYQSIGNSLPKYFTLKYQDIEGDQVMLSNEQDYKAMLLTEIPADASKSLRISIIPRHPSDSREPSPRQEFGGPFGVGPGRFPGFHGPPGHPGHPGHHGPFGPGFHGPRGHHHHHGPRRSKSRSSSRSSGSCRSLDTSDGKCNSRKGKSPRGGHSKEHKKEQTNLDREMKRAMKKNMKKEMKLERHKMKAQFIQEHMIDTMYIALPGMARILRDYINNPEMNLEEAVTSIRKPVNMECFMKEKKDFTNKFTQPTLLLKNILEKYATLKCDQRNQVNQLLGGVMKDSLDKIKSEKDNRHSPFFGWEQSFGSNKNPNEKKDAKNDVYTKYENKIENKSENKKEIQDKYVKVIKDKAKSEQKIETEYSVELLQEIGTVPPRATLADGTIYKTIKLKNTGPTEWPRSALLIPKGDSKAEAVRLSNVKPGKEFSPVLVFQNPGKTGDFVSEWQLAYKDQLGKTIYTGSSIKINLLINSS